MVNGSFDLRPPQISPQRLSQRPQFRLRDPAPVLAQITEGRESSSDPLPEGTLDKRFSIRADGVPRRRYDGSYPGLDREAKEDLGSP